VRTYLAKEDVLVGVEGVDHDVEHTIDLGLELVALGAFRGLVASGRGGTVRGGSGSRIVGIDGCQRTQMETLGEDRVA
jgi:hypothetical protein